MSVRRGIRRSRGRRDSALSLSKRHQIDKSIEEVAGVVRAGGGFWVVLNGEAQQLPSRIRELQTLDHLVVEADVAHLRDAVRRSGAAPQAPQPQRTRDYVR